MTVATYPHPPVDLEWKYIELETSRAAAALLCLAFSDPQALNLVVTVTCQDTDLNNLAGLPGASPKDYTWRLQTVLYQNGHHHVQPYEQLGLDWHLSFSESSGSFTIRATVPLRRPTP